MRGREEAGITGRGQPHLVVLRGPGFGDVYFLDDDAVVLGSDPFRADVVVRDVEVEPVHAKVCRDGRRYALRDLGTGKGTTLNEGEVADERPLSCGDRISFGNTVLEFVDGDPLREQFHREMQRLIDEDYLTGLLAKNRFDVRFEHSLGAAREAGHPLSILMADIDNLKKINDSHGHLVGEFIVGEVGRMVRELLADGDGYATRFGGDEYQVVLPNSTKDEALDLAWEVRRQVEEYAFERDGVVSNPTISVGVSAFPEDGDSCAALAHAADEALYRAKQAGRNTVSE